MSKSWQAPAFGLAFALILAWAGALTAQVNSVTLLEIRGAIGPATTDYVRRGIDSAVARADQAVVITIDTPGGLDAATRDINQALLAAPVPIITFVFPEGARAASAGTYILYASHIAAMAPATNLGAATPVSIMGGKQGKDPAPRAPTEADEGEASGAPKPAAGSTLERKAINDSVAYIRGLAQRRGRNADWAEEAVRDASSLTATAALEIDVIDLMASSVPELLQALDGRVVEVAGASVTLATAGAKINAQKPDWRNRLLSRITDPTVAYLLFIVGLYGLLLEGYNPGVIVPGVVGAISLLLALYAFQVLPINYAGVALIVLGIILIAAESFAPSFGALGLGGIVALIIGSLIMFDSSVPGFGVARLAIGGIAGISGLAMVLMLGALVRSRKRPVVSGTGAMIGLHGEVIDSSGRVHVRGEDWQTENGQGLEPGTTIRVLSIDGLYLTIEKIAEHKS